LGRAGLRRARLNGRRRRAWPSAPAAAAGHGAVDLDDEVRPVVDQLAVDAHDRLTRLDLVIVEESPLQLLDCCFHQWNQDSHVVAGGQSNGDRHRHLLPRSPLSRLTDRYLAPPAIRTERYVDPQAPTCLDFIGKPGASRHDR
jgi:hypothetical protein